MIPIRNVCVGGCMKARRLFALPVVPFLFVGTSVFLTGKLGQYAYYVLDIAPAVIWLPVGIALAALYLGRISLWIAIAVAHVAILYTGWGAPPPSGLQAILIGLSYAAQALLGAHLLKRFGFTGSMASLRDVWLLVAVALSVTPISAFTTSLIFQAGDLFDSDTLARAASVWVGGVFSVIVVTPFLTSVAKLASISISRSTFIEFVCAQLILSGTVLLLFWTPLSQLTLFLSLYAFFVVLFWIGLRIGARAMTFAISLTAGFSVLGNLVLHASMPAGASPLSNQLLLTELFVVFVAPLFYTMATLIEDRKKSAQVLQRYTHELERAMKRMAIEDKSKNDFIAVLAHELRNPLATILSTLELLRLHVREPGLAASLKSGEEHAIMMRRLLDDLLDVSRVAQKKLTLSKEEVEFQSIIHRALELTKGAFRERTHSLRVDLPPHPVWLLVDALRMEQVFVNLLNNAAKYTPEGGQVTLKAHTHHSTLIVTVRDSGIGIDPSELRYIFRPFHQSSPPAARTGLGIGLWLTKRIVEFHGGSVRAESGGLGTGSTFTVRLPYIEPSPAPLLHSPEPAVATRTPPTVYRILLVDDNKNAAEGLAKLLTHYGHTVALAHSGEEALSMLDQPFDAIILDIGLPDMSGYEVARLCRSRVKPSVQLIALTGYGQAEDKRKAHDAGFDHHLTKPVQVQQVLTLLT